jgi:hypothetical protein
MIREMGSSSDAAIIPKTRVHPEINAMFNKINIDVFILLICISKF